MKKLMLALVLVGTLTLTLGSSAMAADPQSNRATVIDVDTCVPLIGGGIVCIEAQGMVNEISTPSGNVSYVTNYRETIRVIVDSQVIWDETSDERFHALTMDGVLQELSMRSRFTLTTFGQPFCVLYHLHGANGEDQFVRVEFC